MTYEELAASEERRNEILIAIRDGVVTNEMLIAIRDGVVTADQVAVMFVQPLPPDKIAGYSAIVAEAINDGAELRMACPPIMPEGVPQTGGDFMETKMTRDVSAELRDQGDAVADAMVKLRDLDVAAVNARIWLRACKTALLEMMVEEDCERLVGDGWEASIIRPRDMDVEFTFYLREG